MIETNHRRKHVLNHDVANTQTNKIHKILSHVQAQAIICFVRKGIWIFGVSTIRRYNNSKKF